MRIRVESWKSDSEYRENGLTEHRRAMFGRYFGRTFHHEWRDSQKSEIFNPYGAFVLALCNANRLAVTHCYIQVSLFPTIVCDPFYLGEKMLLS